jgi:predicted MFS family arabinose efflux permease
MQYYTFASTYGSGTYNTSTYNGATTTSTGSGSGSSAGGSVLTNTGFDVILAVTVACLIVFAALVVRFWKRPAKKLAAEAVTEEAKQ